MKQIGGINSVGDINGSIRAFINDSIIKKTSIHLQKDDGYWTQFFASLDTIGDSTIAVDQFLLTSNRSFLENPYLQIYGLLQALFIQQDAVNLLKVTLFGEQARISWKETHPNLHNIRQLRNETIGHPIKNDLIGKRSKFSNDEVSSCTIDRSTISKKGFSYILWMNSKIIHKDLFFLEVIELQKQVLVEELTSILEKLQKEEIEHKKQFKDEKLSDLLKINSLYSLNEVYGVLWNDPLAWPSFDYCQKQYLAVKDGLERRYGKFGNSTRILGTAELVKKIDFLFQKIGPFKSASKANEVEFEILVDSLDLNFQELQDHLKEIDKEFTI